MVRRGLIVCYYFPPSGGGGVQRWVKFIKYLSRLNWQFTVITAPVEAAMPEDRELLSELPGTTKILRTSALSGPYNILSAMRKRLTRGYWQRWLSALIYVTDSRKSWNRRARQLLLTELGRANYDCVVVSSPPYSLAMLAAQLAKEISIPVFLDLRDPWTTNPYKIYPSRLHRYIDQKREEKYIGEVQNLISVYETTFDHFSRKVAAFESKNRMVIPNGYDTEDFGPLTESTDPGATGFNLAFSGTFYSHLNRPDSLFSAIAMLMREGIRIDFHHFGQSMIDLHQLADKYGITQQVHPRGYYGHRAVIRELSRMDAFCMILDPAYPDADKTVGGKLYEYLYFKKPVLAVVPGHGEAARVIRTTDSGVVVGSNDPGLISEQLKRIVTSAAGFRFRDIEPYSRAVLAGQLNAFLSQMLPGSRI